MGNSAGKESDTLRDAVHTLLEFQVGGGASRGSEGYEENEEEEQQQQQQQEVWQGIFASDVEEDAFFEVRDPWRNLFFTVRAFHTLQRS